MQFYCFCSSRPWRQSLPWKGQQFLFKTSTYDYMGFDLSLLCVTLGKSVIISVPGSHPYFK